MNRFKSKCLTGALAAVALFFTATIHAALVSVAAGTAESPGDLLNQGSTLLSGTVLATEENSFSGTLGSPLAGTLRSLVVTTGGGYDFYFQILNNTAGGTNNGNDIFRIAAFGFFTSNPVLVTFRTDGLAGLDFTGVGGIPSGWSATQISNKGTNQNIYSADRDSAVASKGGVGFDFDLSQIFNFNVPGGPTSAPQNIEAGERSNWIVIRTTTSIFSQSSVEIDSGNGLATGTAYAVPEPATTMLLAIFGIIPIAKIWRVRRSRI